MRKKVCYVATAMDFQELRSRGWKNKEIAARFNVGKSWITKILSLNKLNEADRLRVARGDLSVNDAYAMTRTMRQMQKRSNEIKCDCCGKSEKASLVSYKKLCMTCGALLDRAHKRDLKHVKDKKLTTF